MTRLNYGTRYGSAALQGPKRGSLTQFGKKRASKYVCNKCLRRFAPGDWGRLTGRDAYRHAYGCPRLGGDA